MKVRETIEPFLSYGQVERMYAPETLAKFRECSRSWIVPHFGDQTPSGITRLHMLQLRRAMVVKGLSPARQYSVLMVLRLLLKFCRTVLQLPCLDPLEIKLPRRPSRPVEYLTEQEVDQLIRAIPTHTFIGLRLRVLVEVLLSTGMRISEALSLDRDSINSELGEAEIIGKGGKPRAVFFSRGCLRWIQTYLERRRDDNPALFITTGGSPRRLSRDDMSKLFRRLRRCTGIKKRLTPHLLRHTFCTSLLHRGADITFIKELAGHRDIQTTARYYLGVDKKTLRQVLNRCQIYGWRNGPAES